MESSKCYRSPDPTPSVPLKNLINKEQPRVGDHKIIDPSKGSSPHAMSEGYGSISREHIQRISTPFPDLMDLRHCFFRPERSDTVYDGSSHDHSDV